MIEGVVTAGDGCPIAWRIDGDPAAPMLLLSNSLGTTMDMWAAQVDAFTENHCVLRYDSRGHGGSGVPDGPYTIDRLGRDVLDLIDNLDIRTVDFCGLSLGGMVGQWLGIHAGERLDRLVIANSSPYMGPPSAWEDRIALVRTGGMAAIADAVVERWFTPAFRAVKPAAITDILDMLLSTRPEGYCANCAAIAGMDMRPFLRRIATPALVIAGTLDPATPPEHARMLTDGLRAARMIELETAHLSNVELPECFSQAIRDFLRRPARP